MTSYTYAGIFLAAVAIGMCIPSWLEARRSARRLAAAELAFWQALMRVVDGAETPARAVGEIRSVRAMREQIAADECRRLREDIERWESA